MKGAGAKQCEIGIEFPQLIDGCRAIAGTRGLLFPTDGLLLALVPTRGTVDTRLPIRKVRATRSKWLRAEPVALSIDSRVQGALRNELMRAMTSTRAIGAAGVVLDANTGEIVALSSLPSFNPNLENRLL